MSHNPIETWGLAVPPDACALERNLKSKLLLSGFAVLAFMEGFLVCFNLIKICYCTSLATCLTAMKTSEPLMPQEG